MPIYAMMLLNRNSFFKAEKNLTFQAKEISQKSQKTEMKVEKDIDMIYKNKSEQGDSLKVTSGRIQMVSNRNKFKL